MELTKANVKKRLRNWKTWTAIASLLGFVLMKSGAYEAKGFIDELMPYLFAVGVSLGVWSDHDGKESEIE
ncbi:hypothetical protein HNV23_08835 [Bacillus paranthracis]|uniref:hypothetical protein n=1 Tax=Bacillus paranthracis TaxID=2026186 RepID=UPI00148F0A9F|nr:hypothetical protein [Bacillus paranthracis]NOP79589.1 hypothetical protein [Bacillus paranthracis]